MKRWRSVWWVFSLVCLPSCAVGSKESGRPVVEDRRQPSHTEKIEPAVHPSTETVRQPHHERLRVFLEAADYANGFDRGAWVAWFDAASKGDLALWPVALIDAELNPVPIVSNSVPCPYLMVEKPHEAGGSLEFCDGGEMVRIPIRADRISRPDGSRAQQTSVRAFDPSAELPPIFAQLKGIAMAATNVDGNWRAHLLRDRLGLVVPWPTRSALEAEFGPISCFAGEPGRLRFQFKYHGLDYHVVADRQRVQLDLSSERGRITGAALEGPVMRSVAVLGGKNARQPGTDPLGRPYNLSDPIHWRPICTGLEDL